MRIVSSVREGINLCDLEFTARIKKIQPFAEQLFVENRAGRPAVKVQLFSIELGALRNFANSYPVGLEIYYD